MKAFYDEIEAIGDRAGAGFVKKLPVEEIDQENTQKEPEESQSCEDDSSLKESPEEASHAVSSKPQSEQPNQQSMSYTLFKMKNGADSVE